MDNVTWAALALTLTVLGSLYSWWAFRHRGLAPGLRGVAVTLLVPAAWLTGTLSMFTRIATAISQWATTLAFSPQVWVGIGSAALSGLLLVVARAVDHRRPGAGRAGRGELVEGRGAVTGRGTRQVSPGTKPGSRPQAPAHDDEFDDIEELLRRRGIQ
ncbi:cellulose synthase [Nocardioides jishulii]|uniref:Cellulose synthase n=1 Tax=Nocardioides jishulii TaxID=2575440 RepID=A0A4U2YKT1_9ACTN|nr:cellulose synthase [Nocardioides jishulii]QCX27319.1 cellulose synthase [Nocardioides jishulii]TKI61806.1 cellulose synthase [Nocardioides jishulii]